MTGLKLIGLALLVGLVAAAVSVPARQPSTTVAADQSGPLCCSGDACVEWSGSSCSGVLGWSDSYSVEVDADTGIAFAERGQP